MRRHCGDGLLAAAITTSASSKRPSASRAPGSCPRQVTTAPPENATTKPATNNTAKAPGPCHARATTSLVALGIGRAATRAATAAGSSPPALDGDDGGCASDDDEEEEEEEDDDEDDEEKEEADEAVAGLGCGAASCPHAMHETPSHALPQFGHRFTPDITPHLARRSEDSRLPWAAKSRRGRSAEPPSRLCRRP